jgi:osmotically-inducible protein OsmY
MMNRNWDIFRTAANGADASQGTQRYTGGRQREREKMTERERDDRGEYVLDGGRSRGGYSHELQGSSDYGWGARGQYDGYGYARDDRYLANLYEHEHDQRFDRHAGGPQFEETPHPSLWQRVKGAFSGKGPKNWTRLDERIREDVCERLADHPHIDASDIEVVVKDGEVTLVGLVDHRRTKRLAEDVTEEVRGVKDIHNQIKVKKG